MDAEIFKIMKDTGFMVVSAGIESGSNKVLDLMKKQTPSKSIVKFYTEARKAGLPSFGSFIVANEGEGEAELSESMDMIIETDMITDACLLDVYPGTLNYRHALQKGLITDEWYHLNKVAFGNGHFGLWSNNMGNSTDYVNVSDIPNDVFWPTLYRQLRRFETHFYNNIKIKNLKWHRSKGILYQHVAKIEGDCAMCGSHSLR